MSILTLKLASAEDGNGGSKAGVGTKQSKH